MVELPIDRARQGCRGRACASGGERQDVIDRQVARRMSVALVARAPVPVLAAPCRSTRALRGCQARVVYSALSPLWFDCRAWIVQRLRSGE